MAWIDGSSFEYDAKGWSMAGSLGSGMARNAGTGQNGLASIRGTLGATAGATYGYTSRTEIITGFAHVISVLGSRQLVSIGSSEELRIMVGSDGSIIVQRNAGAAEIGRTASGILQANVSAYIEIRAKASASVGEVEIHINGDPTPALDIGPVNTGGASYTQLQFFHTGGGGNVTDFSAWYLLDTTTAAWASGADDDFLGHIRYGPLDAIANGNSSQLAGSDGNSVNNFELIDDGFSHDSDTTYVQSATVGEKDTYGMENLPTTPLLIYAVQPVIIARKTDAGTRGLTPVIRSGGSDYDSFDEHFLSTSYSVHKQMIDQNPDGPATWDETAVNGMELGVEVTT